ncbi:MAG: chromosomal replication initiator protein [Candidatus Midichloriaceae bacterium]|jgi:chromosomal replication initiator protein
MIEEVSLNLTTESEDRGIFIWNKVLSNLESNLSNKQFNDWLSDSRFLRFKDDTIVISVKNSFIKEWVINNYFFALKKELTKVDPKIIKLSIVAEETSKKSNFSISTTKVENVFSKLNSKYVFDNYVLGDSNNLAYKICRDISKNSLSSFHNKIFYLHSGVGMGKTHLLQSIAQEVQNLKTYRVGYLSAEKFMHNFIRAVKKNSLFELRDAIASVDLFLIDDIHFICGKESTQKEFSLILNTLIELNKTVVIASSTPPHILELSDLRTKSLLISGNIVHIKPFDYTLRMNVLNHYNDNNQINFDKNTLNILADKITTSVRELEAGFSNLTTYLSISGKEATIDNVFLYIQNHIKTSDKKISVEKIIKGVSKFYNIATHDIISKKRTQKLVFARQIIAYLSKELTHDSLKSIGKKLGDRNHATVLYYLKKFDKLSNDTSHTKEINSIKISISL